MALILADRVRETCTSPGTGTATLLGAVSGYQSFAIVGNTNTTYYAISDQNGTNWETGIGTYTLAGTTLARTTVLASSNANALVNFATGTQDVILTYPASKAVYIDANGNVGIGVAPTGLDLLELAAGTATKAPLGFTSGTLISSPDSGSVEYDGSNFYITPEATSGRTVIESYQQFRLTANGTALTGAAQNFFGATSAASLIAATTYNIECFCLFLKTTAGTAQWIPTFSSAVTLGHSDLTYTPVTGFTTTLITGALVSGEATNGTATVLTHLATASLTTAVNHIAKLNIRVVTNAACNFRLNLTTSAGTATPLAGSFYTVRKVVGTTGTFVA